MLVAGTIGTLLGLLAGFYRGWLDSSSAHHGRAPAFLHPPALAIVGTLGPDFERRHSRGHREHP